VGKLLAVDYDPSSEYTSSVAAQPGTWTPVAGPARLKLALQTLAKALNELRIAFGLENNGGEVAADVQKLARDIEKELQVWQTGSRNVLETSIRSIFLDSQQSFQGGGSRQT